MSAKGSSSRRLLAGGACALALAMAWSAHAEGRSRLHVPSEPLAQSLRDVARQTRTNILFAPEAVSGLKGRALDGAMTAEEAVSALIAGLPLEAANDDTGGLVVRRRPAAAGGGAVAAEGRATLAAATAVDEVIVTATKRPEAARRISGSVTALSGQQLESIGASSFSDYLTRTPGVVFNDAGAGWSSVTVRGVSTTTLHDTGQATTGYFINDVPLSDPYFSVAVPDIDAFDVDNVAVLRGPQGTLFGSASMGGAINYQAAKPNLSAFQAHAQVTADSVDHGDTGGAGKLMLNLPIVTDKLAVRGVFTYRDDPGFIDNVGVGVKNSNQVLTRGARIEVTWAPTENTRINYLYLRQTQHERDSPYDQPFTAGALNKDTGILEPGNFATTIHNLRLDQDFGFAILTATASYHQKDHFTATDGTPYYSSLLGGLADPLTAGQVSYSHGVTFEARLASPTGRRFEYLLGAMTDDTHEFFDFYYTGVHAADAIETLYAPFFGAGIGQLGAPNDVFYRDTLPFEGKESAVFGEATYHFTDQLKLTVGGRAFKTSSDSVSSSSGFLELLLSGSLSNVLQGHEEESGFTPKVSLTWTPNDDLLVYGLYSQGFRFGGPNVNPGVPPTFKSDSLDNYELGVRTNWWDRRLQLDATAFYIDWSDIQLTVVTPSFQAYAANAGKAVNYGFEGSATLRPIPGLTLQANLTYLNASLREDFDPGAGQPIIPSGSVLPGASKWQVSDSASYTWNDLSFRPTITVLHRYVSKAPGEFGNYIPVTTGDYNVFDLRVGAEVKGVGVTAFVENIGDARGITTISAFTPAAYQRYLIRPRTIGLTFDYKM